MLNLIGNLTFRLLLCAVIAYLAWQQADVIGLIFASLVFGLALPSPILALLSHLKRSIKYGVFSNNNGRHYEFQNIGIDIIEDNNHECWLSLKDVRKVIEDFPRDAVVVTLYPDDFVIDKKNGKSRLRANALVSYLQRSSNVTAMKFKLWIEREVIFPKKQLRQRHKTF